MPNANGAATVAMVSQNTRRFSRSTLFQNPMTRVLVRPPESLREVSHHGSRLTRSKSSWRAVCRLREPGEAIGAPVFAAEAVVDEEEPVDRRGVSPRGRNVRLVSGDAGVRWRTFRSGDRQRERAQYHRICRGVPGGLDIAGGRTRQPLVEVQRES